MTDSRPVSARNQDAATSQAAGIDPDWLAIRISADYNWMHRLLTRGRCRRDSAAPPGDSQ